MLHDVDREAGCVSARSSPLGQLQFEGFQNLFDRDVRTGAADVLGDAIDAVGFMFEYLARHVSVLDGDA
ncbi:hypothetical protein Aph02nite_10190 [Actinoplanes philippinensis]|uniref:hypothetical protein n=1 Tax=Actinoplanes philippinensis TaxID=35752 RepID=UPI000B815FF6|nr:hypothetical protein [Actinoplanes philippinensis]GIE75069.1 hypothetical protein Aph02nite_10190 [Actinoplanes philippinensis]